MADINTLITENNELKQAYSELTRKNYNLLQTIKSLISQAETTTVNTSKLMRKIEHYDNALKQLSEMNENLTKEINVLKTQSSTNSYIHSLHDTIANQSLTITEQLIRKLEIKCKQAEDKYESEMKRSRSWDISFTHSSILTEINDESNISNNTEHK